MLLDAAYAYDFEEPPEDEFVMDRYDMLEHHINIFPQQFRQPIVEKTLFENKKQMQQFRAWCEQTILQIEAKRDVSHDNRQSIIEKLSPSGRHIYSQSLHDADLLVSEQRDEHFVMLLNTEGGFIIEAIVELTFTNAQFNGILDCYYIYDEFVEHNGRIGLRILSSAGYPFEEATIWCDDIVAKYYYRPSVYVEPNGVETLQDFIAALNSDDQYVIVENHRFIEICLTTIVEKSEGIFAGEYFLGESFEQARARIYCATYEDPYAHFSEEIAIDELTTAIFGDDQTLKVRAFNTIFAHGEAVAHIVNDALARAPFDEDNMYFGIMASHFNGLGCLSEANRRKWCSE